MPDFGSGLPIRSFADGSDERVHIKICDGSTPAQMATVDTDGNVYVKPFGADPAAANVGLRVSELGAIAVDGVYDGTNNSDPSNTGLIVHERAVTPADGNQKVRVTGINGATSTSVWALDVALHDEDGEPYSNTNPMPVKIEASGGGTPVWVYVPTASVTKKTGIANHDYTVAGSDMTLSSITVSSSAWIRVDIQIITAGPAYTTIWTGFNSTAEHQVYVPFIEDYIVPVADGVRIKISNYDEQDADVFSVLEGEKA